MEVVIRPIVAADEEIYRELMVSLSERDRYLRFFHTVPEIGSAEVNPFVTPRPDVVGLIAVEDGRALGAAHAFVNDDKTAEFAIEVRPDHRHEGIGGTLLSALVRELRRQGIRELLAHSLYDNANFSHLAHDAHMAGEWEGGGVTRWRLRLDSLAS